jgi:hypothetical protein
VFPYAGPTQHPDDSSDAQMQPIPYHHGPNTDKRIVDEIPRSILALVAAVIRWVLLCHNCLGAFPQKLPDMSINNSFAQEVDWLIRRTMAGSSLIEITTAVKNQDCPNSGTSPTVDRDDGDIMSDCD